MIEIIPSEVYDIPAIMPIMNDAFDPAYGEAWTASQCLATLSMPNCQMTIAQADNDVAGFAITRWVLDEEELLMIGVSKYYQRQNLGSQLLRHILETARSRGRKTVFLEVRKGNPAEKFYKKLGFAQCGERKNYYRSVDGSRYDAITMLLNL